MLAYLMAKAQTYLQDPNVSQIEKNLFQRKLDEMNGVSREMLYIFTKLSPDETRAKKYAAIINAYPQTKVKPKNLFQP